MMTGGLSFGKAAKDLRGPGRMWPAGLELDTYLTIFYIFCATN